MFGGKIKTATRREVKGTYKQHAYQDTWHDEMDIEYDGELTSDVCNAICEAYKARVLSKQKHQSGYGQLRWSSPDKLVGVDCEKRTLVLSCSVNLCD